MHKFEIPFPELLRLVRLELSEIFPNFPYSKFNEYFLVHKILKHQEMEDSVVFVDSKSGNEISDKIILGNSSFENIVVKLRKKKKYVGCFEIEDIFEILEGKKSDRCSLNELLMELRKKLGVESSSSFSKQVLLSKLRQDERIKFEYYIKILNENSLKLEISKYESPELGKDSSPMTNHHFIKSENVNAQSDSLGLILRSLSNLYSSTILKISRLNPLDYELKQLRTKFDFGIEFQYLFEKTRKEKKSKVLYSWFCFINQFYSSKYSSIVSIGLSEKIYVIPEHLVDFLRKEITKTGKFLPFCLSRFISILIQRYPSRQPLITEEKVVNYFKFKGKGEFVILCPKYLNKSKFITLETIVTVPRIIRFLYDEDYTSNVGVSINIYDCFLKINEENQRIKNKIVEVDMKKLNSEFFKFREILGSPRFSEFFKITDEYGKPVNLRKNKKLKNIRKEIIQFSSTEKKLEINLFPRLTNYLAALEYKYKKSMHLEVSRIDCVFERPLNKNGEQQRSEVLGAPRFIIEKVLRQDKRFELLYSISSM